MRRETTGTRFNRRSLIMVGLLVLAFLVVAVNLFRIMIVKGDYYKSLAEKNQLNDSVIPAMRGTIYDTNGIVLAQSANVWKIYLNAHAVPDDDKVKSFLAKNVSKALEGVEEQDILDAIEAGTYYYVVKSQVEYKDKEEFARLLVNTESKTKNISKEEAASHRIVYQVYNEEKKKNENETFYISDVIGIDPDIKRYYPCGTLASHVIGFANSNGEGKEGVEKSYDSILSGVDGRLITIKNGRSDIIDNKDKILYEAQQGSGIQLTLDTTIQRNLEKNLAALHESSGGVGTYGIIMNVNTGAIIAMASVPDYDPNNPYELQDSQKKQLEQEEADGLDSETITKDRRDFYYKNWRNFCVSDTYEPGSVFKTVTTSAALETGKANEGTSFYCGGIYHVAKDTDIQCHNHSGHGQQVLKEGLENSCNPYFIQLGAQLGAENFFRFFEAFGFTEKTGVDLPGEPTLSPENTYHSLEDLEVVELASSSFGQTFEITPLHMITAISAIANGGKLVTPYIVDKVLDVNGNVISETKPVVRRQVISEETANLVTEYMVGVVDEGTGRNAKIEGYKLAGKTGTSEKLAKGDEYYVASFACFAPADDPEIACLIIVDEPKGRINGGDICTPVAAKVMEFALEYYNVERSYTASELANLGTQVPSVIGTDAAEARNRLSQTGFTVKVVGSGEKVTSQSPALGTTISGDGIVVLYTDDESEELTTTVPDLSGYSVSTAKSIGLSCGINVKIAGNTESSGVYAYEQDVAPGTEVEYGTVVTVSFRTDSGIEFSN